MFVIRTDISGTEFCLSYRELNVIKRITLQVTTQNTELISHTKIKILVRLMFFLVTWVIITQK